MPRPTSKDQLLAEMIREHAALDHILAALTSDQLTEPGIVGPWSIKDVLAHLTAWEQLLLGWYAAGKRGEAPHTPAEGFTWRQIPALNQQIYEHHHGRPLDAILSEYHASYQQIREAVSTMSSAELFTPRVFPWTNTTTLGSYVTSATSSHYAWARKEIQKGLKQRGRSLHFHTP